MEHQDRVRKLFDSQSPRWSGKYSREGPLSYRPLQFIGALRETTSPGGTVLDFGCGSGNITSAVAEAGFCAHGVDVSAEMIEQARNKFAPAARFTVIPAGGVLPMESRSADAVIASSVLEYVPDLRSSLSELARVTREGGHLISTVPNVRHFWRKLERFERQHLTSLHPFMGAKFRRRAEYLALSVHRYSIDRWSVMLDECGWTLIRTQSLDQPLIFITAARSKQQASL
jgi:ubiquinone/menaquinone biosynthesis C-methylase UbiE